MSEITEHDSEQERERDGGVERWIDLLVGRDAVRIDHCLEALSELIRAVVRRRLLVCAQLVQDWRDVCPRVLLQRLSDTDNYREGGTSSPWLDAVHLG